MANTTYFTEQEESEIVSNNPGFSQSGWLSTSGTPDVAQYIEELAINNILVGSNAAVSNGRYLNTSNRETVASFVDRTNMGEYVAVKMIDDAQLPVPEETIYTLRNDAGIAGGRQEATITGDFFSYITPASVPSTNKIGVDIGYTENIPMWTDVRAIEFEITRFDTGNLSYTGVLDPGFYPNAYSSIFVGDSQWTFYGDDVQTVSSPVAGSGLQVVGIVINGTTGDLEFYLDGSLVGTATSTLNTSTGVMFTLYWDGTGGVSGEGIEGYVRTEGSTYTYSYGVGVNDFQGNPL